MIKCKYNLRNIALAIIFLLAVTACDDGLDKLQVELPIIELLAGEDIIKKNVRDTIPLLISIKIAASEKLASFELTKDGEVMDIVTFTSEFSSIYQYEYTIEDGLEIGDKVLFGLKVTDQAGQETIRNITLEFLDQLFFLGIVELNGQVLRSIEGIIDTEFTMSADTSWIVEGELKVQPGAVLNIEAGTTIYMRTYSDLTESSSIRVQRDGKVEASGTKDAPIVFTSDKVLTGNPQGGDWGSFTIQGRSPVNTGIDGVVFVNGPYGGQEPTHNSGTLRYVRIEYTAKNGSDGLRLQGVGSGTTLEYIQVYKCSGEGLKIAGGTFNMRYFVGTAIYDDGVEWEHGFLGKGQFWVFESDTERQSEVSFYGKNSQRKEPIANPIISNVTILGPGENAEFENGGNMVGFNNRGIRLTNGTHGKLYNFIITQFNDDGVRVQQAFDAGDIDGLEGNLVIAHTHSFNNADNYDLEGKHYIYDPLAPPLDPSSNPANAVFNNSQEIIPGVGLGDYVGSLAQGALDPTTLDPWFLPASYIGAIENEANDWTSDGTWCKNLDNTIR